MRKNCELFLNNKNFFSEAMYHYRAYGLLFSSQISITQFTEEGSVENPDVYIRQSEIFGSDYIPPVTMQIEVSQGKLLLRGAKTATILVTGGNSITVEPLPGSDSATVRQLLLGWALAGLFYQRAMLPLHGSALCNGDDCFVFCAPSGGGKSTLTSAFLKKGFSFLDDNVALAGFQDETVFIASGSPELRLWRDSMHTLDFEHRVVGRIRPDKDKTSIIVRESFRNEKAGLKKIFVLKKGSDSTISFVTVTGAAKFQAVLENAFCIKFMNDSICNPSIFHCVRKLVERVPVVNIILPRKLPSPEALCESILSYQVMH